ncbi:MAG: cupredoxin domain-containing protein [Candidatus Limnocylindria bacterium]
MAIRRIRPAAAALLLAAAAVSGCSPPAAVRVELTVHYSGFEPSEVSVPHGVPVTFVITNQDPIDHEWLVGDDAFHERHRTGTDGQHGSRPDEVSLPALRTVETTLTFDRPGRLAFICHLPRHEEYGMVGRLTVT